MPKLNTNINKTLVVHFAKRSLLLWVCNFKQSKSRRYKLSVCKNTLIIESNQINKKYDQPNVTKKKNCCDNYYDGTKSENQALLALSCFVSSGNRVLDGCARACNL